MGVRLLAGGVNKLRFIYQITRCRTICSHFFPLSPLYRTCAPSPHIPLYVMVVTMMKKKSPRIVLEPWFLDANTTLPVVGVLVTGN